MAGWLPAPLAPGRFPVPGEPGRRPADAWMGSLVLASAAVTTIEGMRRARQRYRLAGEPPEVPDTVGAAVEGALRHVLAIDGVRDDLACMSAVVGEAEDELRRCAGAVPIIGAVAIRRDEAELTFVGSTPWPRTGSVFAKVPGRAAWRTGRDRLEVAGRAAPAACGGLVTVGTDGDGGTVLVNLEAAGSLVIGGDDDEAMRLVSHLALESATSSWAGTGRTIVAGMEALAGTPGLDAYANLSEAMHVMRACAKTRVTRLADQRATSAFQARLVNADASWEPLVVFCTGRSSPDDLAEAVDLAGDGSLGIVFVSLASADPVPPQCEHGRRARPGPRWSLLCDNGRVRLPPLGVGCDVVACSASQLDDVATTLHGRGREGSSARRLAPATASRMAASRSTTVAGVPPGVEVRVLGPVEVAGCERPLARAWTTELVVYLAMHRGPVANDVWATALWPDRLMAPASLHSTASAARRALGRSGDGSDHLPHGRGHLCLGPHVVTDWESLCTSALSEDETKWASGLELVRGRPFEGLRGADWAILEGLAAWIEAEVVDLAERLGSLLLTQGDADGAEWAARQGLRVSRYDERLYRILLRSADLAGNPAGVEATMEELVHVVDEDVEPYDAVHPQTWALYRELSRRGKAQRRARELPSSPRVPGKVSSKVPLRSFEH
ncbi:MAG: hypothetical protein M0020_02025 [Actinomycetota bacterium]|nr:hypothetical protein [Actinomycetota bacterium]